MKQQTIFLYRTMLACILAGLAVTAYAGPPAGVLQKSTEFGGQAFNRDAALQRRAEVHDWLKSEALASGTRNPVRVELTAAEKNNIDSAPRGGAPERVGMAKSVNLSVSFSDVNMSRMKGKVLSRSFGAMRRTSDGGYVFSASLSSPGATALRVHFKGFNLPANSGLFLFTEDGQVFGPYTRSGPLNNGEFWSNTVSGDTVNLQLRHVGPASKADLQQAGFNVAGVGHVRPRFQAGLCNFNASCVENAACGTTDTAVNDAKNAVARILYASGRYLYLCSGGLLADTDGETEIPYFLTANHCISKGREANTLETFFQFTIPCSTNNDCSTANHPGELRTLGSSIKSTGRAADYTLLQLSAPPQSGSVAYLGWNATPVAFSNGTDLFRISHPAGAPQAYSTHEVDTSTGTCTSWPRGDRIYSRDTFGGTEGGSSGSPVVNAAGDVVGQLSGACGTNVGNSCDSVNNATVDGAFAAYFPEVAQFLDPDTDPGNCTPVEEICGDGIDNDCDGEIDSADSDCGGGGGDGLGTGEMCLVDTDCASNKCKGKPGSKTCK